MRCDREDVCRQREIYADNGQEMHRQRKWVRCLRAVSVLSPLCQLYQCALTATEMLRKERMCANSGGINRDNVQGMHRQ